MKPVTGSEVACQLCLWASGENIIVEVKVFILCNINMFVKHFALFHTSRTLVEYREMIASLDISSSIRGRMIITRYGKEIFRNLCYVKVVQLIETSGRDQKYDIGTVDGYGDVDGRV